MKKPLLEARRKKIPLDQKILFEKNFAIMEQIFLILAKKGKDQKYLADSLKKSESEISKWLRGNHNFTMKTIAKIEAVLGEAILICPKDAKYTEFNCFFELSPNHVVKVETNPVLKRKAIQNAGQHIQIEMSAQTSIKRQTYSQQIN